jgi:hypothetical protein
MGHLYSVAGEKSKLFSIQGSQQAVTEIKKATTVLRETKATTERTSWSSGTTVAAGETPITLREPSSLATTPASTSSSSTATVMALASDYGLNTFMCFVGSLRRTGYSGHIILGLEPNPPQVIVDYLHSHNVTVKTLSWTNCTYTQDSSDTEDIFKRTTCAHPYPDIKVRWSRFPLARDWLQECTTCTGPVLITDARSSSFNAIRLAVTLHQ